MNKIDEKLYSIMKLYNRLENEPRNYGTDVRITGTGIHIIEIIGNSDDKSVTDIARISGVTKGAVSQKLKKLAEKGLVEKREDPDNLSRSIITLTSKGKVAYYAHKHWHETMDGGFGEYCGSISDEKQEIIIEFLSRVEDFCRRLLAVDE